MFLPNCNVYTNYSITFFVRTALIDDSIYCNGRFPKSSVTNNEFPLTSSDWHHSINCFNTGFKRRVNWFTLDNAGCDPAGFPNGRRPGDLPRLRAQRVREASSTVPPGTMRWATAAMSASMRASSCQPQA